MKTDFSKALEYVIKRKLLSPRQLSLVKKIIDAGDSKRIGALSRIFNSYMERENMIIRNFVETKDRLFRQFNETAEMVKQNYIVNPRKSRVKRTEKREKKDAEKLLKELEGL